MAGIYFHIPFCKQACHYCDFHFSTNLKYKEALIQSLAKELLLRKEYLGKEKIETVYFGGGTPSLLNEDELQLLLSTVQSNFDLSTNAEITLEANPDDLTNQNLNALRSAGINRLSIGVQSFDNIILRYLNRAHDAEQAVEGISMARSLGFNNISIDLISAIPGQTDAVLEANIQKALSFQPEHVSVYSLTIEKRTAFGYRMAKGNFIPTTDDAAAYQLNILIDRLTASNYEHYEVSNFCKPGFHSRHNSNYWNGEKYIGIGPSAHSYNKESRQFNLSNNSLYIKALSKDQLPFEIEPLSREDQINEYLLTKLRTLEGVNLDKLKRQFDFDVMAVYKDYIDMIIHAGHAVIEERYLRLTRTGRLLADKISSDLFVIV
jgi:oxygen-independent coproporphyrinogen-3 oxidase